MILLAEAAAAAAPLAMSYFRADPDVWMKAGNSPVSEADIAVDRFLRERLTAARPDYGWLSEETADDPARLTRSRVFVVDPIDGTRAFIAGREEWAISAAVVENGRPVAAALFQPATGAELTAARGQGAFEGTARLRISGRTVLSGARIAVPKSQRIAAGLADAGFALLPHMPSLALRLARVAQGTSDLAFATGSACDWDLAAADLIVEESGGALRVLSGGPVIYNAVIPRHEPLVVAPDHLADAAMDLLRRISGSARGAAP